MPRAGQTPHGARPNREEPRPFWQEHGTREALARMGGDVPARCVKPPGRSLEPRSNARPRGMAVPSQDGQNSAYRSGCLSLCISMICGDHEHSVSTRREQNSVSRCVCCSFFLPIPDITLVASAREVSRSSLLSAAHFGDATFQKPVVSDPVPATPASGLPKTH